MTEFFLGVVVGALLMWALLFAFAWWLDGYLDRDDWWSEKGDKP